MSTEMQERDAIVSNALEIASAAVREAYIAGACGNDAALRRQVEEQVSANLQGKSSEKPAATAVPGPRSSRRDLAQAGANHTAAGEDKCTLTRDSQPNLTNEPMEVKKMGQKKPRGMMTVWALLLLPATVGGASLTMWKMRADDPNLTAARQAREERDQAQQSEALVKKQLEKEMAARLALEKERDETLTREKAARRSEQDSKAVLAFLQDKLLLSTGNPASWSGDGLGKDVTLRKAVDAAEAKVAGAFADRPLVEASIREILGSTYLELGDTKRAVRQYEQALALREAELGPDHPETGDSRNQLAVAYRRAGRTDDASRLFDFNMNHKGQDSKRKQNPARGQGQAPRGTRTFGENS
ncbi:MAG TPA: tetratricopeptide repeat protein [Gemmataceae bacterium]|nr:tetratricopeptide repeat protein [Gemmataceae bacterium]